MKHCCMHASQLNIHFTSLKQMFRNTRCVQLALSTAVQLPHVLQRSKPRACTSLQGLVGYLR